LIVQRIDKARVVAAGIYVAIIGISGNTQSRRVHQVRILENGGADIAVIDRFEGKDGSPSQFGIEAQARLPGSREFEIRIQGADGTRYNGTCLGRCSWQISPGIRIERTGNGALSTP